MHIWLRVLLALALMTSVHAEPILLPLQSLIDATPSGGILRLYPGRYSGPVSITRPMIIDGGGRAEIIGDRTGTIVSIAGQGVTLKGLRVAGSGDSHDRVDSGILIEGIGHRIEGNRLDDVLFGIHLRQASQTLVSGNSVHGKDLSLGVRGDAIRVWNGHHNEIRNNRFERARDLTFTNAPDNRIVGNRFHDGRYGLHALFSPRLHIENNELSDTGTGIIILYSRDVTLLRNYVAHALTGGGAGIVFKESDTGLVEGNTVLHCAVGLKVDAPPEPVGVLMVRNNRFAHNIIGLFFYGEAGGHQFENNAFENNLTTIAVSGIGAGARNSWQGNHWDEYQGFDRNSDGIGDTPHEAWLFADRIWMEQPFATFFRNSPSLELLDFLERLAPFSSPYRLLSDPAPRML
jgi:nitrous oxidase accessory protein